MKRRYSKLLGLTGVRIGRLLLCYALACGLTANAQEFPSHLRYLTTDDGLSQNTVDYVFRDSQGFMWFATWNGLCRYDGYQFRVYKADGTADGLPSNFVHTLAEDSSHHLWIGTTEGLGVYDLEYGRFVQLTGVPDSLGRMRVNALHYADDGQVWIGTDTDGFHVLQADQAGPRSVLRVRLRHSGLRGQTVNAMYPVAAGGVLVGTNSGLFVVGRDGQPRSCSLTSAPEARVLSILADETYGWIGTDAGLVRRNLITGEERIYQSDPSTAGGLLHNAVTSLAFDQQGHLLVGTLGGLNIYRPLADDFLAVAEGDDHRSSLNNRFVNSLAADPIGNVWIGTDKGGINQYNLHQHRFGTILHHPHEAHGLSNGKVNSILSEGRDLWVGTAGGGLNLVDGRETVKRVFRNVPDRSGSLSSDFVTSLVRDSRNYLWVGTWGGGLNRLDDPASGTFSTVAALSSSFISSLHRDTSGFILIGSESALTRLDPRDMSVARLDPATLGINISEVGSMILDRHDDYWIGTRQGLYRFPARSVRSDTMRFAAGEVDFFDRESGVLPGNYVLSLHEARDGSLWVGTYGYGLVRLIRHGRELRSTHFDEQDGLCNNVVYAVQEARGGELWLSTDYGLSCFDPATETFKNYYANDGLPSNQFYWSASAAGPPDRLYFGSIDGLVYFNPADISNYLGQPTATLTRLTAMGEEVHPTQIRHGRTVLTTSLDRADRIELSYLDNAFTLEFAALDYFLSEKVQFAYRMRGIDQDWVTVPSSRRFASYTNLGGGEYVFEVRASNGEGQWQRTATRLQVIVHPPFWRTNWFYVLLAVVALLSVFSYTRWRTRYLQRQTRKLESLVRQRTAHVARQKNILKEQADRLRANNKTLEQRQGEIAAQKNELEVKNREISQQRDRLIEMNAEVRRVNDLRLRFFTNVSHEFRTPLTLIIAPIENLLAHFGSDDRARGSLQVIYRNARRLLHLINQLMDFRTIEEGKHQLRPVYADLGAFLTTVGESFRSLAEHRELDFNISIPGGNAHVWFDTEKLEHVVYNLLSNAIKYTPAGQSVRLSLSFDPPPTERAPESFTVTVADRGIGIEAGAIEHILDPFYRVPGTEGQGSGIGLSLIREIVHALKGKIEVQSQPGAGSTFRVTLPCTEGAYGQPPPASRTLTTPTSLAGRIVTLRDNLKRSDRVRARRSPTPPAATGKPTILIVEDNYDLRTLLVQSLEAKFRVLEAGDGVEGYQLAARYSPEAIISDIMMPRMNGIELCRKLKVQIQTSHIPVILLTAKALVENQLEGLREGADDYLSKPCNLEVLHAKIDNLIQSRRRMKKLFARSATPEAAEATANPVDREFLSRLYAILSEQYAEATFSQSDLAEAMCMSRSLLYKKVRSLTDMSVTDFVNRYKIKRAIDLMAEGRLTVSEVAYCSGFQDPKYFSRVFKKFYGMSPSAYFSNDTASSG
ncbi:two-component regulator propeller domain-containing protein [Neolewinella sp.]|uniref:two-component regulator propeller domain-containing protein n=1 Tax=Neolewinella sp. TaxID=2993543 RepID=UPI003B53019F